METHTKLYTILVLGILLLGAMVPSSGDVTWTEAEGKVVADTDNLHIEVTGESNVPAYTFRGQADSNTTQHRAQFVELFEFEDANDNGKYDENDTRIESTLVAMASLDVALSSVVETNSASSEISFNMSLTAKALINLQFSEVTFENHVSTDNDTKLKFDVIIEDYSFTTNADMLALSFMMTSSQSNDTTMKQNSKATTVEFGQNAYVESQNTAQVGDTEVDVSMTVNETADGSIQTYFAYPTFNGKLVHDPSFGVDSTSSDGDSSDPADDGANSSDTDNGSLPLAPGMAALGLIAIPVVRYLRKQ